MAAAPRTVVVADDDPLLREVLGYGLHQEGYDVLEAADGVAALRAIRRLPTVALVTDVVMPGMDGVALARAARQLPQTRRTPIVAVTGLPPHDARIAALRRIDRLEIVFKPFSLAVVARRIQALIDHRGEQVPPSRDRPPPPPTAGPGSQS